MPDLHMQADAEAKAAMDKDAADMAVADVAEKAAAGMPASERTAAGKAATENAAGEKAAAGKAVAENAAAEPVLREIFCCLDQNLSGYISADELFALCKAVNQNFTAQRCADLVIKMDASHNGNVSLPEFIVLMGKFMEGLSAVQRDRGMQAMWVAVGGKPKAEAEANTKAAKAVAESKNKVAKPTYLDVTAQEAGKCADTRVDVFRYQSVEMCVDMRVDAHAHVI